MLILGSWRMALKMLQNGSQNESKMVPKVAPKLIQSGSQNGSELVGFQSGSKMVSKMNSKMTSFSEIRNKHNGIFLHTLYKFGGPIWEQVLNNVLDDFEGPSVHIWLDLDFSDEARIQVGAAQL